MSRPTVWRSSWFVESPAEAPPPFAAALFVALQFAAVEQVAPRVPTKRRLVTLCRDVPAVRPSAWKYEYSGLMSSPLNGENSRSEEHTSELQSPCNLVCRILL